MLLREGIEEVEIIDGRKEKERVINLLPTGLE